MTFWLDMTAPIARSLRWFAFGALFRRFVPARRRVAVWPCGPEGATSSTGVSWLVSPTAKTYAIRCITWARGAA